MDSLKVALGKNQTAKELDLRKKQIAVANNDFSIS